MASRKTARYLVISDTQIPFEHPHGLTFCKEVQREYDIPKENILHVGDEVDQYFGSLYDHDPDALHTPNSEIRETIDKLKLWYDAFPMMRIAESNHGQRWINKAFKAKIPSIFMRKYQEVLEAPPTWKWAKSWRIASKHPFGITHGVGYSGMNAHRQLALNCGISMAMGHLHSFAGIAYVETEMQRIWGMNVGCLIDVPAYAFHYGKDSKFKPSLGVGVVIDDGLTPIWLPYPRRQ